MGSINGMWRSLMVMLLLLAGVTVIYLPELAPAWRGQQSVARGDGFTYVADLDFWQRTDREQSVIATTRFDLATNLENVPLTVGDWVGEDVPETNQEVMILLDPEQYVQRLYHNSAGQYLWLSLIGGRSSQPFHAPDICYDADGWQYNLGSHAIALDGGGDLYGLWLEAKKQLPGDDAVTEHIVYYFYLFPDAQRRLNDGIVLFKVTTARYGTIEETLELQASFVRQLFTSALKAG
ncbi:MAG TPA: exosortase-associated EpsI family protein [Caldilineaceae bacterium]|nr:exosortase-associated EpsI family protein [Caldilineaceae bacterium]